MAAPSTVEIVDIDKCLEQFNNSRFQLILAAARRAREIANKRMIQERAGQDYKKDHKPTVAALIDFANGLDGKEYLYKK